MKTARDKDAETRKHIRDAVMNLVRCWEALGRAEHATGEVFYVADIEFAAGDFLQHEDVASADEGTVQRWLDDIRSERGVSDE